MPGQPPDTCLASDFELNSTLVQAGETLKAQDSDPTYSLERHYRTVDLELLYFNNTQTSSENCDRTGPALGVGPFSGGYNQVSGGTVTWAVPATDASGVWRVLVVASDNTVTGGQGSWVPVELTDDGAGTWRGSRAFAGTTRVTYVIQAVDNHGNVTWLEYVSAELPSSGVPPSIPDPVDVTVTPPPVPTITSFTPTSGPVGTLVSITGTGFEDVTASLPSPPWAPAAARSRSPHPPGRPRARRASPRRPAAS